MHHEHVRPDWGNYVNIHSNEVEPDKWSSNFAILPSNQWENSGHPFELDSVMMYRSMAFAIGNNPTITLVAKFSNKNVWKIFFLYNSTLLWKLHKGGGSYFSNRLKLTTTDALQVWSNPKFTSSNLILLYFSTIKPLN